MSKLYLHDHPFSSYAQKARLALRAKGIPFDFSTPEGLGTGQKLEKLGSANPRVEVPALEDGDLKVFDSKVILEYLEEKFPEPPLLPKDIRQRAQARMIQEVCDTQYEAINWGIGEVFVMERATGELAQKLREQAERQTKVIHEWLSSKLGTNQYFNGETYGFADVCVVPYYSRSTMYDLASPEDSPLHKWFLRVMEIPSVKETITEARAAASKLAGMKGAFKPGAGNRREYRDHRLEWMIKSGGLPIVQDGIKDNTIRFSWPEGI